MSWGWNVFVTNVPAAIKEYGPVGAPAPQWLPFPAGPASAGPVVLTPVAVSGGDSTSTIDPWAARRRVMVDAPLEYVNAREAPTRLIPENCSLGNPIIRVMPCNPLTTPRIRPPKLISPQLAQAGTHALVRAAAFSRGGAPRGVWQPEGVATASPAVVTRWNTYG